MNLRKCVCPEYVVGAWYALLTFLSSPHRPRAGVPGVPRGSDPAAHLSPLVHSLLLNAADAGH